MSTDVPETVDPDVIVDPEPVDPDVTVDPEPVDPEPVDPVPVPIIIESPPNPIVELMKKYSKFALLIGLNYVDYPEIALTNRISIIEKTKQFLINNHGFCEENILILLEPNRDDILITLNTIIGSSSFLTEFWIYYSGYGNGIIKNDIWSCSESGVMSCTAGFCCEPGIIDNLMKQMMPSDFVEITQDELNPILTQSCCKTICIMDMCPFEKDMVLKWGADVNNRVKIITFCESDSYNTNKTTLLKSMLQSYLQIVNDS
jgi:hypothetical protein